jgi:hypothetical protein
MKNGKHEISSRAPSQPGKASPSGQPAPMHETEPGVSARSSAAAFPKYAETPARQHGRPVHERRALLFRKEP